MSAVAPSGTSQNPGRRIIFALDVSSLEEARKFVRLLKDRTGLFKVGLELFTAFGKEAVRAVQEEGGRVFLDLKFHDIPNTVSRAAEEAVKLGVDMLNLHASGGAEMMRETADRCRKMAEKLNRPKPILLAVTILTSLDEKNLKEVGLLGPVADRVVGLAELSQTGRRRWSRGLSPGNHCRPPEMRAAIRDRHPGDPPGLRGGREGRSEAGSDRRRSRIRRGRLYRRRPSGPPGPRSRGRDG